MQAGCYPAAAMRDSGLPTFLRLDAPAAEPVVAVLPVPYERTTSWGRGTENGPEALLLASHYVELYDEELDVEPCRIGIETLPPVDVEGSDESVLQRMSAAAETTLRKGRFLAAVGGEHTVTPALVRGALDAGASDLGVVQFDAHADLRQTYRGTPWNHACAMSRVLDLGLPTLGVGIRSLTRPEAARIANESLPIIWAEQLDALPRPELEALFDGLLASVLPATGTPEPGGGTWYQALALLRRLFEQKRVIAMDVVELAPIPGNAASDFTAAKLLYKCIGYRFRRQLAATASA